jgi:hypothetical protein
MRVDFSGVAVNNRNGKTPMTRAELVADLHAVRVLIAKREFAEADKLLKRMWEEIAEEENTKGEHL